MKMEEKVIDSKTVYHGHILDVELQHVRTPMGTVASREIVHHAPAVALLVIDPDEKMIIERQWREAVGKETLEIPAGKVDTRDAKSADHAAVRELNEETRLQANKLQKLSSFYTSVGCMDEYMTLYLATDVHPVVTALPQDEDEEIELLHVTLDEAMKMVESGQIEDAKTVMAIYYWRGMNK